MAKVEPTAAGILSLSFSLRAHAQRAQRGERDTTVLVTATLIGLMVGGTIAALLCAALSLWLGESQKVLCSLIRRGYMAAHESAQRR
jgi:hypothetical protein